MRSPLRLLAVALLGSTALHCASTEATPSSRSPDRQATYPDSNPAGSPNQLNEELTYANGTPNYAEVPSRVPSPAIAEPAPQPRGLRIELVDDAEQALPAYSQGGQRYVLGQIGERYQIRIVNPTGARVEAVVSVDGLDAIDGRPANLSKRGYILAPYGEATIDGFRTSLDSVATFRFSSVRDSYAGRTKHARNVGVIGVAFFRERPPPVVRESPPPMARRIPTPDGEERAEESPPAQKSEDRAAPAPANAERAPAHAAGRGGSTGSSAETASRPGLGTEFGEARESHVAETTFVRADSSPMAVSELRYDDREGLLSRGIELSPPPRDPHDVENAMRDTARPFPVGRFAQAPR
jgi:hypothetical protein